MKKRILIGLVLIASLAGIHYLDAYVLERALATRILLWLLALGALHETLAMGSKRVECNPGLFFYGSIALVAVVTPYLFTGQPVPGILLALAAVVAAGIRFIGMAPLRSAPSAFPEALLLGAAILYTGGLLSFLDRLLVENVSTAIAVVAVSKTSDICGYFVGSTIGRKRIVPAVSPKKTWEGTIAGVLGSAGVALLLAPELVGGPAFVLLIGALLGVSSLFGDLIASGLKRWSGVKDSASLLPEFGGVVDLLDGILVAAPVAVICLYGA